MAQKGTNAPYSKELLSFRVSDAFEQDLLRPLFTEEAYRRRRHIGGGTLRLESVAVASEANGRDWHQTGKKIQEALPDSWKRGGQIHPVGAQFKPVSKIVKAGGNLRRVLSSFNVSFPLDAADAQQLGEVLHPYDEEISASEAQRSLHLRVLPAELWHEDIPNHEKGPHVERHMKSVDKALAETANRSLYFVHFPEVKLTA